MLQINDQLLRLFFLVQVDLNYYGSSEGQRPYCRPKYATAVDKNETKADLYVMYLNYYAH